MADRPQRQASASLGIGRIDCSKGLRSAPRAGRTSTQLAPLRTRRRPSPRASSISLSSLPSLPASTSPKLLRALFDRGSFVAWADGGCAPDAARGKRRSSAVPRSAAASRGASVGAGCVMPWLASGTAARAGRSASKLCADSFGARGAVGLGDAVGNFGAGDGGAAAAGRTRTAMRRCDSGGAALRPRRLSCISNQTPAPCSSSTGITSSQRRVRATVGRVVMGGSKRRGIRGSARPPLWRGAWRPALNSRP